jgi:hypothetical protein
MFNIYQEMPSGARSQGLDALTDDLALKQFERMVSQAKNCKGLVEDVVLTEDGVELQREHINNAKR